MRRPPTLTLGFLLGHEKREILSVFGGSVILLSGIGSGKTWKGNTSRRLRHSSSTTHSWVTKDLIEIGFVLKTDLARRSRSVFLSNREAAGPNAGPNARFLLGHKRPNRDRFCS